MAALRVTVAGWVTCPYYQRAHFALRGIAVLNSNLHVEVVEHPDKPSYVSWLSTIKPRFSNPRAQSHTSSPIVWLNESDFLGGCDDTLAWLKANYMAGSSVSRPPRVHHASDVRTPGDGEGFDYDLVVIGGGSGGLACSQAAKAADPSARVMVLDYVKPSWVGTKWGLGGTCVNVGCIPKKLMHTAALLGEALVDARAYGWELPAARPAHSWPAMVQRVQDHIASLNFGYKTSLREAKVDYVNALGAFKDRHTLSLTDRKGAVREVRARRTVIAVGGRPSRLDIPGGELAISSDDIFSLEAPPGKTLVVGASYVALECAGFLAGLGCDTTVMVRSILLRGFDQECAEMIGSYMQGHGVAFARQRVPVKIERSAETGRLRVTSKLTEEGAAAAAAAGGGGGGGGSSSSSAAAGDEVVEEYDTVFTAVGREADTRKLGLEAAGVQVERNGKIPCTAEQTNVPNIYAIGDVVFKGLELTPVAIAAGRALAKRLFGGSAEGFDHARVPTTVFTPLEYGCIGLSEEDATAQLGGDLEVYHSKFTPLEHSVVEERAKNVCFAKLLVNKRDDNRVVGFHVLGPNAGEITQGWAAAFKLGATYETFMQTVGIHPTMAEEFTQLTVTKASGESADKGNC